MFGNGFHPGARKAHRLLYSVRIIGENVLNTQLGAPENRTLRYFCVPILLCPHYGIEEGFYFPVPNVAAGPSDPFFEFAIASPGGELWN